ncbi:FMN-binding protein [Candidatus Saccharibacteria bacterium]|nr:FMN-binding protein [Candidatus Saccharibacteria bacterium]
MKKGVVIILAVAIIGALGVMTKNHKTPATQAMPSSSNTSASTMAASTTQSGQTATLKDGTYTGDSESTVYGDVQIRTVVSSGKISDVIFLQMPNDRGHTQEVTAFAKPLLKNETIGKQNAQIDFVSGATQTSEGYQRSLQSALDQAV